MAPNRLPQTPSEVKSDKFIQVTITGVETEIKITTDMTRLFSFQESIVEICSSETKAVETSIPLHRINHKTTDKFALISDSCPVEFYFKKENTRIKLPDSMTKNLVKFFKEYKPSDKKKYCCINFAYEMVYGRNVIFKDNRRDDWEFKPFNNENLIPGSVVYLFRRNILTHVDSHFHYAVNIACGSYFSLFGTKGPMMVARLKDMMDAWGSKNYMEAVKHSKNVQGIPAQITESKESKEKLNFNKVGVVSALISMGQALFVKNASTTQTSKTALRLSP